MDENNEVKETNSTTKQKEKKSGTKALVAAGAVLLVGNLALSGASLAASMKAMDNSKAAKNNIDDVMKSNDNLAALVEQQLVSDETREDDVLIAGSYTIRSTTQISDAYISGDTSALSDKDKETLQMASDILDEIITDGMSDYEKEKAVYLWMTKELGQDESALLVISQSSDEVDNPYGVLKSGNAVCVGYATTFRLFMQMLGIECKVVHNSEAYHSWDLVKLDDEWYHVDIYSDAGVGNYAYFNLSDNMMQESWDTDYFPAANGIKYNYYYNSMVTVDDIYGIPEAIRNAVNNKEGGIFIKFNTEPTATEMTLASQMVQTLGSFMYSGLGSYSTETNQIFDATSTDADYMEMTEEITPVALTDIDEATSTDVLAEGNSETATSTDAAMEGDSSKDMPMGMDSSRWVTDPNDGSYILFVTFEPYYSEYDEYDTIGQPSDDELEKANEKLKESFGDIFEDIQLSDDDYYYDEFDDTGVSWY